MQISWRLVFWINLLVGLIAVVLAVRVLTESRDERIQGRPDLASAVLLAATVALVALALVKASAWGGARPASSDCSLPQWRAAPRW